MSSRHNIKLSLSIIESPSPDEIFDGRTEGSVLNESLKLAGIPASYNVAVNLPKFIDALVLLIDRREREQDSLPILHLSMHGHKDGVSLTDGFFLTWDRLGDVLLTAAKGNLLVCMSSCFGFSGCRMAMSDRQGLPFLGIVGHDEEVNLADAAVAYAAFYHRLFKGDTVPVAVDAMQKASGDSHFLSISGPEARNIWKQHLSRTQAAAARAKLSKYLQTVLSQPGSFSEQGSNTG